MKTVLVIYFSTPGLDEIRIEQPGYFPSEGEVFDCKWEDFCKDNRQLQKLNEVGENDCWMVERLSCYFSKEIAECRIVLHESGEWEKGNAK